MPSEQEINKIIHKARGLRWVDGHVFYLNPSYTSDWSAYGEALEWAQKQKWWRALAYQRVEDCCTNAVTVVDFEFNEDLLNPLRGSTALAEFILAHPEIFKEEG